VQEVQLGREVAMEVRLANPRGFCAGVDRAIEIVERALKFHGSPIYVHHEVVHNKFVVDNLRRRGAIFVDRLADIPDDSIMIFSAHGVSRDIQEEAKQRGFRVFDATCPLVTKVHLEVAKQFQEDQEVILIGHAGHPEVEGTMGQYGKNPGDGGIHLIETIQDARDVRVKDPDHVAFVTQTTLSLDDTTRIIEILRQRFPRIKGPRKADICYATQNRQNAVKALARSCEVVLVVGSPNSSNSNRLVEIARNQGIPAYLVDNPGQIESKWVQNMNRVGVTAGASAPEVLVQQVVARLEVLGAATVEEVEGQRERVYFPLPSDLQLP